MDDARFQSLISRIQNAQDNVNALRQSCRAKSTQLETRSSQASDTSQYPASAPPALGMFQPPSSGSIPRELTYMEGVQTLSRDATLAKSGCALSINWPAAVSATPQLEDARTLLSSLTSASWRILYDKFCRFYCNDLPFLCPSTILEPTRISNLSTESTHSSRSSSSPWGPNLLRLGMVALTIRHCKDSWRCIISGHDRDSRTAEYMSAHCASLAMLSLSEQHRLSRETTLEEVQGKLFLSSYHWSTCQWSKARRLLKDAMLGMHQLKSLSEGSEKSEKRSLSAAMAFEAGLMGLTTRVPDRQQFISGNSKELLRRTLWSCCILDIKFSLGQNRVRLSHDVRLLPNLPLAEDVSTEDKPSVPTGSGSNTSQKRSFNSYSCPNYIADGVSSPNVTLSLSGDPQKSEQNPLGWYVRALDLLGRITAWDFAEGRKSEVYPPWDKRSDWNTFLRQSLAINHNIVGQLQLTPINILIQCQSPMAAKYLSLHAARLLCQLFIHWEFLPFLPVNCVRPVGLGQEARQIYEAADAPTGFWLSNARMCFQAARSILDLASFVENHVSLMEDAFTSYAVFVASFIRIYARAFPWMDVEQQLAQCEAPPIFAGNLRHFDSSASQSTTPKPPGDESIVSLNDEWSVTLASIAKYFEDFKLDYYTTSLSESYFVSDICVNQLRSRRCLRDGGAGEGLEEYKLFRSKLRNFGHE